MNRIKTLCLALLTAYSLTVGAFAADLFTIDTSLNTTPSQKECAISVPAGEVLAFDAADLERRMDLAADSLQGITVTALPPDEQGALVLEGVEVEPYQFLTRAQLSELCFVPNEAAVSASVTLLPQGLDAVSTHLAIGILNTKNTAPMLEGGSYSTVKNARISGFLSASDPDGDTFSLQVVQAPQKGEVTFNGQSFAYEPYRDTTGNDSFTVCAVDRFGNYSTDVVVDIKIETNRGGFRFMDMTGNPSEYAAIKLHEKNLLSGEKVGESWFFTPDRQVTRGELLVMVLAASGMDKNLTPTVNTRLENDTDLPMWLKPYVKKAIDEGMWDAAQPFSQNEIPSRSEAVLLVDQAAKITDVKDYTLQIGDVGDIPNWALTSYKDLAAYKMLDLHDGNAYPASAVTNSYAADLVWQLYKHYNR